MISSVTGSFTQAAVVGGFTAVAGSVGGSTIGVAAAEGAAGAGITAIQGGDAESISIIGSGIASFAADLLPPAPSVSDKYLQVLLLNWRTMVLKVA